LRRVQVRVRLSSHHRDVFAYHFVDRSERSVLASGAPDSSSMKDGRLTRHCIGNIGGQLRSLHILDRHDTYLYVAYMSAMIEDAAVGNRDSP
jgi:hypothetical protein